MTDTWLDPPQWLIEEAKKFLKRSGIRDVVLRHEGKDNEQAFSWMMAFFAINREKLYEDKSSTKV